MSDIIGSKQNFLPKSTILTAGGDEDDDNDDNSTNFDLTSPFTLVVNVNPDLVAQAQAGQAVITAIHATGSQGGQGVWGQGGDNGIGVLGETADPEAQLTPLRMLGGLSGVRGDSVKGHGVVGSSTRADGVFGTTMSIEHSGVFGTGNVGVCGLGLSKGPKIGVLGITDNGIHNALAIHQGAEEAVRGYSVAGFALRGVTEKNYAGVFETGVSIQVGPPPKKPLVQVTVPAQTAQVRLVPATIPKPTPTAGFTPAAQQFPGLAGDLLALRADNGDATLWFCFRDGVHWKQIA